MKSKILSLLSATVLVLALGSMAKADTTYDFTYQNGNLPAPTNLFCDGGTVACFGYVTVSGGGSSLTITFTAAPGFEFDTTGGWNESAGAGTFSGVNSCTDTSTFNGPLTCVTPSGNTGFDGFGSFTNSYDPGGNGSSSGATVVTITIGGSGLTQSQVEGGFEAALAVENTNTLGYTVCTGKVGTSASSSNPNNTADCGGTPPSVPEPGSLALFGTGALGLAGYLRRKLFA